VSDKKLKITTEREARGFSKQQLSFASHVPATTIGQIEHSIFVPYGPQLERLARALGFLGKPEELLEPVDAPAEVAK
jgi:transcriptional regulator with XRE-family HTH domain